ncbi:MAG: hypothetical protein EOS78_04925 [Mesorhizobium sp.]|nr:MAG: hypothetical protein EOS78_04925 [Mesorhizobium sp.]
MKTGTRPAIGYRPRFGFDEAMGRKRLLFAIRPGCSLADLKTRKARWEATPKHERLPKHSRHTPLA